MSRAWQLLTLELQNGWIGQLARFGIAGGFVTMVHLVVYWTVATPVGLPPLLANVIAQSVSLSFGYVIHSSWSFKGFDGGDRASGRVARYVIINALGFALNSLWVWLFTGLLHGATWWPMPTIGLITPLLAFWLNRQWVFRKA